MKTKIIFILLCTILMNFNVSAHEEGHGASSKIWIINDEPIIAEFVKFEDEKVFLLDAKHELSTYYLSSLTPKDQAFVLKKHQNILAKNSLTKSTVSFSLFNYKTVLWYFVGIILMFLSLFYYQNAKKRFYFSYGILGAILIVLVACNKEDKKEVELAIVPTNEVDFMTSIFGQFTNVQTNSDDEWFYIASDGIPEHNMMVGITNWQQQVPINQNYTGNNSWAIPIQPELSANPLSTQTNLLKGAIAIAANGIPIFNPLNNRGEDANAIGELDEWGGHCGRADDYHYHMPPTHLQSIVGEGNPIAYAVDGFPIYGETTETLDEYLGRFNEDGSYQYHTVQDYPYFIAGMRGKVTLDPNTAAPENQVIPQAMTQELRPATEPLRDAEITDFVRNGNNSYSLTYTLNNENYIINYSWNENDLYTYEFVNPDGTTTVETYQR